MHEEGTSLDQAEGGEDDNHCGAPAPANITTGMHELGMHKLQKTQREREIEALALTTPTVEQAQASEAVLMRRALSPQEVEVVHTVAQEVKQKTQHARKRKLFQNGWDNAQRKLRDQAQHSKVYLHEGHAMQQAAPDLLQKIFDIALRVDEEHWKLAAEAQTKGPLNGFATDVFNAWPRARCIEYHTYGVAHIPEMGFAD